MSRFISFVITLLMVGFAVAAESYYAELCAQDEQQRGSELDKFVIEHATACQSFGITISGRAYVQVDQGDTKIAYETFTMTEAWQKHLDNIYIQLAAFEPASDKPADDLEDRIEDPAEVSWRNGTFTARGITMIETPVHPLEKRRSDCGKYCSRSGSAHCRWVCTKCRGWQKPEWSKRCVRQWCGPHNHLEGC